MASSRKKQDEKNVKTLRELGALPENKYCFDCGQRGPTYVNVTIGSFVCTKCSGMLRGLTPPHRVKSISMATFTAEEVELLKARGNDYCRRVWLGLCDDHDNERRALTTSDEQTIRDKMIERYERKRYYLDPSKVMTSRNGYAKREQLQQKMMVDKTRMMTNGKTYNNNNNNIHHHQEYNRKRPEVVHRNNNTNLIVDFGCEKDVFNGYNNGITMKDRKNNNNNSNMNGFLRQQQESFANFDANPVFDNTNNSGTGAPPTLPSFVAPSPPFVPQSNGLKTVQPTPPSEDRYAALKDLDNELKQHQQNGAAADWLSTTSGSNGSLYSSPTPPSLFGSPSTTSEAAAVSAFPNPFVQWPGGGNPFREQQTNGFAAFGQSAPGFPPDAWTANPFKLGATTTMTTTACNPNNPFL